MRRLQVDQAVGIAIRKNLGPALSDTCQISSVKLYLIASKTGARLSIGSTQVAFLLL